MEEHGIDPTEAFIVDPVLATTLSKLIDVNYKIDGLTKELVERLQHYEQRYKDLKQRIEDLEKDLQLLQKREQTDSVKNSIKLKQSRIANNQK